MKTNNKCALIIRNKKGDFWQVDLDENGMSFVLNCLEQYFGGMIKVFKNKLPLKFETKQSLHTKEGK